MKGLAIAGTLLLVVGAAIAVGGARSLLAPAQPGAPERLFTVPRGATLSGVARELQEQGLVRSAIATEWLGRVRGLSGRLRAGEYDIAASWPAGQVLEALVSGPVKTYTAVVPEGIRAREIAERLEQAQLVDAEAFLEIVDDPAVASSLGVEGDTLEGYLFPETYRMPRNLPPEQVASILVEEFLGVWREIEPIAKQRKMSMRDVVTLASIVEKETAAPEERPLIAAVFLNRLQKGMRLETDPTVIYGIPDFDGNLKRSHLEDASNPYNTYRIVGLPPGPIASPGADALRAVVEPAESDYLYFVSRNDGTHHFSRTYREHQNAVNRYQKKRRRASK